MKFNKIRTGRMASVSCFFDACAGLWLHRSKQSISGYLWTSLAFEAVVAADIPSENSDNGCSLPACASPVFLSPSITATQHSIFWILLA